MAAEDRSRPFDHLVLPVSGLDAARERLTRLGFTVAPNGVHPFGTANCCVFLADATFLEPLAVVDAAVAGREAGAGNVFVRHDRDFRARNGEEGLSAVVYGTENAEEDHARFADAGMSAGDILNFAREFATPDGGRDRAAFRLAFARPAQAPDCLFFAVERVVVPEVDRSALLRHANGATGIAGVLMTAPRPAALAGFLEQVTGTTAQIAAEGVVLRSAAFELRVLTPAAFAAQTGLPAGGGAEQPRFRAVAFAGTDIRPYVDRLDEPGVAHHRAPAGIVVPPAPGQGTAFIFPL